MKILVVLSTLVAISACGKNDYFGPDGVRVATLPQSANAVNNESHAADCNGPQVTSIFQAAKWNVYSDLKDGKLTFSISFKHDGTVKLKGICEFPKSKLEVAASTTYRFNEKLIEVIDGVEASATEFGQTCRISTAKSVMSYSFHGSCMDLVNERDGTRMGTFLSVTRKPCVD